MGSLHEYLTGNHQEIFAEVIFDKVSAKSSVIDVDLNVEQTKQNNGKAATDIGARKGNKEKNQWCYCNRDFTVVEVKDLVKTVKGNEKIWEGIAEKCEIGDKSWESLTMNLNLALKKYNISRCMQKISFLAQVNEETGFFTQSKEEQSNHKSSQSIYKGRGLLQITGERDSTGYYNNPGPYRTYGRYLGNEKTIVNEPDIISKTLQYTIDVGGWVFSVNKKVPVWKVRDTYSQQEKEAVQWKMDYFSKGLGKTLNELGFLMEEDEEKYFYLQAKILNGYSISHKLDRDPNGWTNRKTSLTKLKEWFKYDKKVCNGIVVGSSNEQSGAAPPPWMRVALNEYATYAGQNHNSHSPLQKRIEQYFDNTVYKEGTFKENWCAAFVTWCLNKGNPSYKEPTSYGSVRARAYSSGLFSDHSWEQGKITKDNRPAYGATAMIVWDGGGQHVALVIGKTANGNIAVLGGNQSVKSNKVTVGRGITKTSVSPKNIKFGFRRHYRPNKLKK